MVVGARNPEGVLCAQRPSCRLSQAFRFIYNTYIRVVLWYDSYMPLMRAEMRNRDGKREA
jgi:hypothetical protein